MTAILIALADFATTTIIGTGIFVVGGWCLFAIFHVREYCPDHLLKEVGA